MFDKSLHLHLKQIIMAFPFSPDTDKLAESRENLAKMREDQAIAKIELAADVTQGQINEATTYQIAPGDIEGSDKPKTPQEQVEEDFRMDLRTLREYQNPQKEEAYHKLYNAPHLRAKYDQYLAEYEAELAKLKNSSKYSQERMALVGKRGKGVGKEQQQAHSENVDRCFYEGIDIKKKIRHLKHLLAPENEMSHFCDIDNKSEKFIAREKAMGVKIGTKKYTETDIEYILFINGKKAVKFSNAEHNVSHVLYLDEEGSIIYDRIDIDDGLHWYTKFRKNNGVIEEWSLYPNRGWKKDTEYPLPSNETGSL
jgi:hypothetical protein